MVRNVDIGHNELAPPEAPPLSPGGKSGLSFFLLLLLLYVGLGGTAQSFHPLLGLLWTELFVFLLPPAVLAAGSNLRPGPFLLLTRRPPRRQMLLGAACGLALFFVAAGIMSVTSALLPRDWVDTFDVTRLFEGSRRHQLGMALVAAVLAPLAEEIAFRGYLLSALRTRFPPRVAIAASALLFAAIHLDPVRFPAVLFLGMFLGWLAWRSGSIWPAVAAHAVNNGLGSLVASLAGGDPEAGGSVAAGLAAMAIGIAVLSPLAKAWIRATPAPPEASADLVRTDPRDPSIRFRLPLVPPGWRALAALGLLLFSALGLLRGFRS
jgi:membrane protease YdiL (CAAX protease family)